MKDKPVAVATETPTEFLQHHVQEGGNQQQHQGLATLEKRPEIGIQPDAGEKVEQERIASREREVRRDSRREVEQSSDSIGVVVPAFCLARVVFNESPVGMHDEISL